MPSRLHLDFETRSSVDLRAAGVYRYAEDKSTEILLIGYAFDDDPVDDPIRAGENRRHDLYHIYKHIREGGEIHAWNVAFERLIWNSCMRNWDNDVPLISIEQCHDTAAAAAAMALPRALDKAAIALGIKQRKDASGKRLMRRMSKNDGVRHPEENWRQLIEYCRQDVIVEREIGRHLRALSNYERRVYVLDQIINDRGMQLDDELIKNCLSLMEDAFRSECLYLSEITNGNVKKPTEVAKILAWLDTQEVDLHDLKRPTVRAILNRNDLSIGAREVLNIRKNLARTSTAKFTKMRGVMSVRDNRARGMLLYHGASTGRWAGRLVQPQNLPRPEIKQEEIHEYIRRINLGLEIPGPRTHRDVANVLRSCFKSRDDCRFIAGDYGQIEARALAWVAGQADLIQKFKNGEPVYEDMASRIYNVSLEKVSSVQRQVGKNSILGAGYQMGAKRFREQVRTQAKGLELSAEMSERAIKTYRDTYYRIPMLWEELNDLAIEAIQNPGKVCTAIHAPLRYTLRGRILWCILPSGRPLAYFDPQIKLKALPKPWNDTRKPTIYYNGIGLNRQWTKLHTYGGKLTENVVQAIARDLLAYAMLNLHDHGYRIVLTVHDEIVCEMPEGEGDQETFAEIMSRAPAWANGLPLKVDTWEGDRFRK